jgi:hypothetical protein
VSQEEVELCATLAAESIALARRIGAASYLANLLYTVTRIAELSSDLVVAKANYCA